MAGSKVDFESYLEQEGIRIKKGVFGDCVYFAIKNEIFSGGIKKVEFWVVAYFQKQSKHAIVYTSNFKTRLPEFPKTKALVLFDTTKAFSSKEIFNCMLTQGRRLKEEFSELETFREIGVK